jgi:hypothetical protein
MADVLKERIERAVRQHNAKNPSPSLLAYATTKGAIANFTAARLRRSSPNGAAIVHGKIGRPPGTVVLPRGQPISQVKFSL